MKITLKYFGLLAEITNSNEEQFELKSEVATLLGLKNEMESRFPAFQKAAFCIALNHTLCSDEVTLNDGDVVAFLPPFAGG